MEITSKLKERDNTTSPLNSPCTTTTSCTNQSPIPITRSDPNSPYPTTFVTADTSSFKQVVQMLTGTTTGSSSDKSSNNNNTNTNTNTSNNNIHQLAQLHTENSTTTTPSRNFVIPPIKNVPKKQGFKLYERRNSIKNLISPLTNHRNSNFHQNASFSPRHKPEILSPSLLDFPSLTLSPVTPLIEDPFNKSSPSIGTASRYSNSNGNSSSSEEDKAIAEKGFYLHPSPISTPRDSEPQLLPLFPLSSPRVSDP